MVFYHGHKSAQTKHKRTVQAHAHETRIALFSFQRSERLRAHGKSLRLEKPHAYFFLSDITPYCLTLRKAD